jgi:hypothetical protein
MDMIERVARTLCRAYGLSENAVYNKKPMWRSFELTARFVLIAMREPDLKMSAVANFDRNVAIAHWNAIIDVALDGQSPLPARGAAVPTSDQQALSLPR